MDGDAANWRQRGLTVRVSLAARVGMTAPSPSALAWNVVTIDDVRRVVECRASLIVKTKASHRPRAEKGEKNGAIQTRRRVVV